MIPSTDCAGSHLAQLLRQQLLICCWGQQISTSCYFKYLTRISDSDAYAAWWHCEGTTGTGEKGGVESGGFTQKGERVEQAKVHKVVLC
jgi:hypothetical protein